MWVCCIAVIAFCFMCPNQSEAYLSEHECVWLCGAHNKFWLYVLLFYIFVVTIYFPKSNLNLKIFLLALARSLSLSNAIKAWSEAARRDMNWKKNHMKLNRKHTTSLTFNFSFAFYFNYIQFKLFWTKRNRINENETPDTKTLYTHKN